MKPSDILRESALTICFLASVAGAVVVTIVSSAGSLPATGLRDISIALAGALAGSKVPSP